MYVSIFQDFDIIDEISQMGSLNMSVVELDEPRHVRHIANLIQDIQFKRDLLQVGDFGDSDGDVIQFKRDILELSLVVMVINNYESSWEIKKVAGRCS